MADRTNYLFEQNPELFPLGEPKIYSPTKLSLLGDDIVDFTLTQDGGVVTLTSQTTGEVQTINVLTVEDLLIQGFVQLNNGKIPIDYLYTTTPEALLADRSDITVMFITGQSLGAGNTSSTPVTIGSVSNYVVAFNGDPKAVVGEYTNLQPLVENGDPSPEGFGSGEIGLAQAGLKLIEYADGEGATQGPSYFGQTTARGSASIEELQKGNSSGYYETFFLPPLEAIGQYATDNDLTVDMPVIIFRQGEQSNANRLTWKPLFEQLREDMMTDATINLSRYKSLNIVSYQTSMKGTGVGGSTLAQWDSFLENDWHTISSPTYVMYGAGLYSTIDKVHLTSEGYAWLGAYDGRAAADLLYKNEKNCTYPIMASAEGHIVTITYNVPTQPLVFDTTLVPAVTDYGFRVYDDVGDLVLSNFQASGDKILFETDRAISTGGKIRFGMDYEFTGSLVNNNMSTNVRDSDTDTVVVNGNTRNLYNWSLQGDIDVNEDVVAPIPITDIWITNTNSTQAYTNRKGITSISELESPPTFDSVGVKVSSTQALDTNVIADGETFSGWVVVELNTAFEPAAGQSALLLGNKNGTFSSQGFSLQHSRQVSGEDNLNKFTLYTVDDGGGSTTESIYANDINGWALVGLTYDAATNTRKIFINSERAWSASSATDSASWLGHTEDNSVEIGKGSYTHSATGSTETNKIALVGLSDEFLDVSDIDDIEADATARLQEFGISFTV